MRVIDIEKAADTLLKHVDAQRIPVPVEEIASTLKIKIGRAPSKDFSGLLLRKDGAALIGVNSDEQPRRQRFTIAHELGHFFLHQSKEAFVDYRRDGKKHPRTQKEREADAFAAALLMPRQTLRKDFSKIAADTFFDEEQAESTVTFLADKYEVSEEAMRIRLMTLGMLTHI